MNTVIENARDIHVGNQVVIADSIFDVVARTNVPKDSFSYNFVLQSIEDPSVFGKIEFTCNWMREFTLILK